MATDGLSSKFNDSLHINDTSVNGEEVKEGDFYTKNWGFPLDELYKLAVKFYKEKEGKAIHLSYQDKLKLVAYTKQVTHGKYQSEEVPDVGFLDVVGNDRRLAWQKLGDLSKDSAQAEFVSLLDSLCPLFKPYVIAHKTEQEEKERIRREEEERRKQEEAEKQRQKQEENMLLQQQEALRQRQYQQEQQIRAALNQQTAIQFRQYAEQQYPGNKELQDNLIVQLQEQHFQQYMQQVYQQQLLHQQQQQQQLQAVSGQQAGASNGVPQTDAVAMGNHVGATVTSDGAEADDEAEEDASNPLPPVAAASMWTRKDFKEFKDSLKNDKDSVIKVGSGETVTVRVPTHEDGTCLFWEFATDYYDIGFGVYFEWTIAPSNNVSVHVSDSSDDEEIEEEEGSGKPDDLEKGKKDDNRPPTDEIIPVYRRDCHEEVYCGSHMYPGRGVYLLKFDNSYSLWRSKTLYYRVYYTR